MQDNMLIQKWILWKGMAVAMRAILIICGGCLIILVGLSVFLRYVLNTTFVGTDDLIVLFSIWLYWMGGTYGSYEDSHISANLTNVFLKSEKKKKIINIIVRFLTALIAGIFAYWSIFEYALWNIKSGTLTTGLRIPYLTSNIALTVSFCLMFLYSLYYLIRSIFQLKNADVTTIDQGGVD